MHERADGFRREHHDRDRDDDGRHHDPELIDHADGGNDGVQREDDVEQHDLDDDGRERGGGTSPACAGLAFEAIVDLVRALCEEEQAAQDQDQVAAGNIRVGTR